MVSRVVLFSGGPDSFITYYYLQKTAGASKEDTVALYANMEHRYLLEEMRAVSDCSHILDANVVSTKVLAGLGSTEDDTSYIHHRNAYLCLAASKFLSSDGVIYLTVQKDEFDLSDRTQDFLDKMSLLLVTLTRNYVAVITPWVDSDKTDMVRWYLDNGGEKEHLKTTWSCYSPVDGRQCGNCPACFRRWVAFSLNGIYEEYAQNPASSLTASVYSKRARDGFYSEDRCKRIWDALSLGRSI